MSTGATPLSAEEIEQQRALTPGTRNVVHLNHAGSSLPPTSVHERVLEHLDLEYSIGGYEAAGRAAVEERQVYESIASLVNAEASEIARVEHATAGWNAGFWSVPMQPGQRIVTAEAAYGANAIAFMRARDVRGITIDVVPSDDTGQVDVVELERRLDSDVALVALTHIPTNGGLVNPAADVGTLTKAAGLPYLLDACQSVGQIDLDVQAIGCDLLSATGRKYLRGPRGTGFLYASSTIVDRLHPNHPDHHGAAWTEPRNYELTEGAQRFEYWEYNHAAWLGLGAAVDHARSIGLDRIEATVQERAAQLRDQLGEQGFVVYDLGEVRSGIVTTAVDGADSTEVKAALATQKINVSVTNNASTLWDATRRQLPPMLRMSVHYTTTANEIDQAVEALVHIRQGA